MGKPSRRWLGLRPLAAGTLVGVLIIFVATRFATEPDERSRTRTSAERQAVEQAYLEFWKARSEANLRLDPAPLAKVATGEALSELKAEIESLKRKSERRTIAVQHDLTISFVGDEEAIVSDHHDIRISIVGQPASETSQRTRVKYRMKQIAGTWKVEAVD